MKISFVPKNLLVTGGAGFIGSNFVRMVLERHRDVRVINLDLLTYAGNRDNLDGLEEQNHIFVQGNILDGALVSRLIRDYEIDSIVHFAAESHVDRSIEGPDIFVETNVKGTASLLQCGMISQRIQRFVQVGTDEVYGALKLDSPERFSEITPLQPRSPYSASKAAADFLAISWLHTYGFPALITRCSNNYGPYQFPEKLIPLMIRNAMQDKPLPVYGDGLYVRDWIHVSDHCAAIWEVLTKGRIGEVYNIGSDEEHPNIEIVKTVLKLLGKPESLISHVKDRPGHDRRYAIDASKVRQELGWMPVIGFEDGLRQTIHWYASNRTWLERIESGAYRQQ